MLSNPVYVIMGLEAMKCLAFPAAYSANTALGVAHFQFFSFPDIGSFCFTPVVPLLNPALKHSMSHMVMVRLQE